MVYSAVSRRGSSVSQWGLAWRRFKRNKAAFAGLIIVGFMGFIATFDRLVAPYPPNCIIGLDIACASSGFSAYRPNAPPSLANPFGEDKNGYDVFSQVIYGTRAAFLVGFGASAISMVISIVIALVAGYYGGVIDNVLMRFTEVFLVLPFLLILFVFLRVFFVFNTTATGGLLIVIFIIGILSWPGNARIIRSETLQVKEFEFVGASRQIGASGRRILFRHILPNVLHTVIVLTTLQIAGSVLVEAGVSFLGFGDPNTPTWGREIALGAQAVNEAWWVGAFPGIFLTLLVMGFNLLGNGLRDALDPRLRE
jgi:ABC-type dipeptide/oligopeptide/nickel transport system permease subunit